MSVERGNFAQRKNPREIVNQAVGNSKYIEELTGQSLIPPSVTDPSIFGEMSEAEAKAQFGTKRYGILVEVMRAELAGRDLDEQQQWDSERWLKVLNGVDRYVTNHHVSEESRVLYPKQMEVFEALGRFLQNGGGEGYFKLPTAFGKTVIFTEFAKAANLRTLIVVPTIEILDQTEDTFIRLAPELELGKVYADAKDFLGQITVTTYESLVRLVDPKKDDPDAFDFLPEDYNLLILDEAHHALGPRTSYAVSQFSNAIKLGFTATPVYSENRQVERLLNTKIYGMSIKEAAEEEQLSPFRVWFAFTNTDISGVEVDILTGDYKPGKLARAVNLISRNQAAIDLYQQYFRGESAVVYCASVKHARDVASLFRQGGVNTEAIWGSMNRDKRAKFVESFRKGEIQVLCNMQVLTEGFDAPNASVCINLRPTLSAVVAEQRGGRVLRLDPANPDKEAMIIDFMDKEGSDIWQVSFAEVAETAGVPEKLQGQTGVVVYERPRSGASRLEVKPEIISFTVGNLRVVTEVQEIMRISSAARTLRQEEMGMPEGYTKISFSELARDHQISPQTIYKIIVKLSKENEEDIVRRGKRYPVLVTVEGFRLINEAIQNSRLPKGFQLVETPKLAKEFTLSLNLLRKVFARLRQHNPEDIISRGPGNYMGASQHGTELIRQELASRKPPKGYMAINGAAVAREFGINPSLFYFYLNKLNKKYPKDIVRRGPNKDPIASRRGMILLREELAHVVPPEGMMPLNTGALLEKYSLAAAALSVRLKGLAEDYPRHIIRKGKGASIVVTEEGLRLIEDALTQILVPKGFRRLNYKKLEADYDHQISRKRLGRLFNRLLKTNPQHFTRVTGRREPAATEEGLVLLTDELNKRIK